MCMPLISDFKVHFDANKFVCLFGFPRSSAIKKQRIWLINVRSKEIGSLMSSSSATNASRAGFVHIILFSIRFYFQNYSILPRAQR